MLETQFCSRLVAQSFAEAGINLVADFDFCTPNQIAASPLLEEVGNAVVQACADEIAFAKTDDYNKELQKETYKWLNKVRALAERRYLPPVKSQIDVGQMVLDNPQLDAEVCRYIRETKYLSFYDVDERRNPWRYHPQLMLAVIANSPSPLESLETERRLSNENLQRSSKERIVAIHNAQSGLKYFSLEERLLTKRVVQHTKWRDAVDYVTHMMGGTAAG